MTDPADVKIIRKAAAVVTLEGGPACHAAINCHLFHVDCITGLTGRDLWWAGKSFSFQDCSKGSYINISIPEGTLAYLEDGALRIELPPTKERTI